MDSIDYTPTKPVAEFPYEMKTTNIMEHSHGIAWTANLLREGTVIGIIEQMGDGGADRVFVTEKDDRAKWESDVAKAFPGLTEEAATYYLLYQEDEV